jgi:hypothetical protein
LALLEVFGDGAGEGVEGGAFDEVGLFPFAAGHEHVAEAPGPVGDVAGFVEGIEGGGAHRFGADDAAVGHEAVGDDFWVSAIGEFEEVGVAGVGIEEWDKFELFGGGDAMLAEGFVALDFGGAGEGAGGGDEVALVGAFSDGQVAGVGGEAVKIEGFFGEEAVASAADVGVEEAVQEDLRGDGVAGGAVFGDEGAASDGVGPVPDEFADAARGCSG